MRGTTLMGKFLGWTQPSPYTPSVNYDPVDAKISYRADAGTVRVTSRFSVRPTGPARHHSASGTTAVADSRALCGTNCTTRRCAWPAGTCTSNPIRRVPSLRASRAEGGGSVW